MKKCSILIICILVLTLFLSACNANEKTPTETVSTQTSTEAYVDSQVEPQTKPQTEPQTEDCSDEIRFKKPVIYLYPKEPTEITVKLGYPDQLTCTYPAYKNGWNITAYPDGTLIDNNTGRKLYSLYWEGNTKYNANFDEGFVVKGSDVITFLEEKLAILGLSSKEAEEFIIYWLPTLQENEYNFIRFAPIDEINKAMPLKLSENPDTVIRVLMQYKPLNEYVKVKEQQLSTATRTGFTVVEWGGCEIG